MSGFYIVSGDLNSSAFLYWTISPARGIFFPTAWLSLSFFINNMEVKGHSILNLWVLFLVALAFPLLLGMEPGTGTKPLSHSPAPMTFLFSTDLCLSLQAHLMWTAQGSWLTFASSTQKAHKSFIYYFHFRESPSFLSFMFFPQWHAIACTWQCVTEWKHSGLPGRRTHNGRSSLRRPEGNLPAHLELTPPQPHKGT